MACVFGGKAMTATLLACSVCVVSGASVECRLGDALATLGTAGLKGRRRMADSEGCSIDVQQAFPDGTFAAYGTYAVTVRSAEPATLKLFSEDGQCQESTEAAREATFEWTAPAAPVWEGREGLQVTLRALCQQADAAAEPSSAEVMVKEEQQLQVLAVTETKTSKTKTATVTTTGTKTKTTSTGTTTTKTTTTAWNEAAHIPLRIGIAVVLILVLFALTQWGAETRYISDTLASQEFARREAEMTQSNVNVGTSDKNDGQVLA